MMYREHGVIIIKCDCCITEKLEFRVGDTYLLPDGWIKDFNKRQEGIGHYCKDCADIKDILE